MFIDLVLRGELENARFLLAELLAALEYVVPIQSALVSADLMVIARW